MLHTPVENYTLPDGLKIMVKREDLSCPAPGPTFSKVRGVYVHLKKLREQGILTVGYVETAVSMAGWGVAWAAKELGMKAIIYAPVFLNPRPIYIYHFSKWEEFGAEIVPIEAGMAKVAYYKYSNVFYKKYGKEKGRMLKLGLPFEESVQATCEEVKYTFDQIGLPDHLITCVGSGTICGGIVRGIYEYVTEKAKTSKEHVFPPRLWGIMCRNSEKTRKTESIMGKAKVMYGPLSPIIKFSFVDKKWEYTEPSSMECPFPCHPYYDLKAYQWMVERSEMFHGKSVLFWNIGSLPNGVL